MANNSNAVAILKPAAEGVVWYAPVGTPLPEEIGEALDPAFKTAGYVGNDGFEKSDNFEAGDGYQAFGGDTVVNGTNTMAPSMKFTIIETGNPDAMALAYNKSDITGTINNLEIDRTGKDPDDCVMVYQFLRSNNVVQWDTYEHMVFGGRDDVTNDNDTPDSIPVTWNARKVNGSFGKTMIGKIA